MNYTTTPDNPAAEPAAPTSDTTDADNRAQLWAAMFAMVSPPFQPQPDDQDHDTHHAIVD